MQKTANVKATKLMVDDHLKVGGVMFRITNLNLSFGRGNDRVMISMHPVDSKDRKSHTSLAVPSTARFTIYNQ